jgi:hypothetical protein
MDRIDLRQHRVAAATNVPEPKRRARSLSDNQALKQRFLVRAEALSEQPEEFRCKAVTQLIGEMVAFDVRAEGEVFQAAYGDSSGQKYWDAHLSEAIPVFSLAYILSVHLPGSVESLEYLKFAILCAFRDAAEAGERWFTGEITPLLAVKYGQTNFEELSTVKVHPRAAVEWLLIKPKREHLVPESLRLCLQSNRPASRTPAIEVTEVAPIRNKPGAGGVKMDAAIAAMVTAVKGGKISMLELRQKKQKRLVELYPGAKRTLLAEARCRALKLIADEQAGRQNSDIMAANDK